MGDEMNPIRASLPNSPSPNFFLERLNLNCSDLLPHEDGITDPKTEKGDRQNGDQIGRDDVQALRNRKGALEAANR